MVQRTTSEPRDGRDGTAGRAGRAGAAVRIAAGRNLEASDTGSGPDDEGAGRMGSTRSRWAALGAAVTVALGGGGLLTTSASLDSGERGVYVPITPCRVMDTRPGTDNVGPRATPLGAGEAHAITVRGANGNCTIPTDAVGLVMNVAVINPTAASFLTVYPADATRPLAANANWTAGQPPLSNAVTTDIGADGRVAFYNLSGTVDLAADVLGYYTDHTHDDRYPTDAEVDTKIAAAVAAALAAAPAPAGATRVAVDVTGTTGRWTAVALDTAGTPVISYYDVDASDVKLALCSNPDCTGTTIIRTIDAAAASLPTDIVVLADGRPSILYTRTDADLVLATCADPTCSSTTQTVVADGAWWGSMAIGSSGFPVISYYNDAADDLRVAACNDATCTSAVQSVLDHQSGVMTGIETSIAIGADGNPVISYLDFTNRDLRVAKCTNATCSAAGTSLTTLDSGGDVGSGSSIAVGPDGNPVVAYYDGTNDDLRFAACANPQCTGSATITTIDSTGDVGKNSSVAIGADGYPIVAYYDSTALNLQVAKCGASTCAGALSLSIVEALNDVGSYLSMAIDSRGAPVISHFDATNGDLRVAKCATTTCFP